MTAKARVLLDALKLAPARPHIVEVGCIRHPEEREGDGWSTLYLAHWAWIYGGTVTSIDTNADHIRTAKGVLAANLPEAAAVQFLHGPAEMLLPELGFIDFLYLDGPNDPLLCRDHFDQAQDKLRKAGTVVVDDCEGDLYGKGHYIIPSALHAGWTVRLATAVAPRRMAILTRA